MGVQAAAAQAGLDAITEAARRENLVRYDYDQLKFSHGARSALGPEYHALVDQRDMAEILMSGRKDVLGWIEGEVNGGRSPTLDQINEQALKVAQANEIFHSLLGAILAAVPTPARGGGLLAGSGPVSGVIEVSARVKSVAAFRNYKPPGGGIEFVFDPTASRFAVGKPARGLFHGSPHQQLAASINANGSRVLGGTLSRGPRGEVLTNEFSGHYGHRWTNELRQQFTKNRSQNLCSPVDHVIGS